MPIPPDNPEPKNTYPQPELNPLLNPVLGAHMGRWAEVYFTNPPEKRDEAVIELLRELVAEGKPVFPDSADRSAPDVFDEIEQALRTCASCGVRNPLDQRFCGMCGADGRSWEMEAEAVADTQSPIVHPELSKTWPPGKSNGTNPELRSSFDFANGDNGNAWDRHSRGSNRAVDEGPKLLPDYEPASSRQRILLGATLALLLSTLVYMAWRTQAGLGTSQSLPSAPAPISEPSVQPQAEEIPRSISAADSSRQKSPARNSAAKPTSVSATSVSATPAAEQTAPVQSARGSGTEELAIAESYLNGAQGKARDEGEAAKWLWKAVGKQNAAAALLLSDLYLRGSGVSKNCDQARLLLDASARKGTAGAAERLRNLQAFGCH